jgi:hypothetical protein
MKKTLSDLFTTSIDKSILVYAVLLHFLWGILLILGNDSILNITAIHSIIKYIPIHNPLFHGLLFFIVGGCAGIGLLRKKLNPITALCLIIPQQILLIISAEGAIVAMIQSAFADGVIRPRAFLIADQCPVIIATLLHTFALLRYHLNLKK